MLEKYERINFKGALRYECDLKLARDEVAKHLAKYRKEIPVLILYDTGAGMAHLYRRPKINGDRRA